MWDGHFCSYRCACVCVFLFKKKKNSVFTCLVLSMASWGSVNLAVFFFIGRMEISLFLWKIFSFLAWFYFRFSFSLVFTFFLGFLCISTSLCSVELVSIIFEFPCHWWSFDRIFTCWSMYVFSLWVGSPLFLWGCFGGWVSVPLCWYGVRPEINRS